MFAGTFCCEPGRGIGLVLSGRDPEVNKMVGKQAVIVCVCSVLLGLVQASRSLTSMGQRVQMDVF